MSIYIAIAITAFFDGVFTGAYIRTGVDASPSGVGVKIIDALSPLIAPEFEPQIEFMRFVIVAIPWVITAVLILLAPHKILALVVWGVVFVATALFIGYF